ERAVGFPKEDVLTSGLRHHGRKLGVAKGAENGHDSRDNPNDEEPSRRTNVASHFRRDDEDPRADHRAGDQHRAIKEPETLFEAAVAALVNVFPTISVTGPSLPSSTLIPAPNCPAATGTPSARIALRNESYIGMACSGRAAPMKLGRRPF